MTTATTSNATAGVDQSTASAPVNGSLWLAAFTLWKREMVRFFRQRNRVIGAIVPPLMIWLMLGSGLNNTFKLPAAVTAQAVAEAGKPMGYLEYFFPGAAVMILLFTAIFTTISVIEDRREGFMQAVLVAPVPRFAIVLGKVLGGATIATLQGLLFLLLWPLIGPWMGVEHLLITLLLGAGVMFVLAVTLTSLSLCFAWPMDSVAGFHAVMNLVLMPMWFLSGAVFPVDSAPMPLRMIMYINPLTYGQAAFASAVQGTRAHPGTSLNPMVCFGITLVFALVFMGAASLLVSRPRKDGMP
jgi:ABC-2 type transport system permease protein